MKARVLVAVAMLGLGAMLAMPGCASESKEAKTPEIKVKLEDCPPAVQQTIKKELGSGQLGDIAKETKAGATVYEADAKIDGKDYETNVAADGKLISKAVETEKDEKGDKDKD